MNRMKFSALAMASFLFSSLARAQYADTVISYSPGTGLTPAFTNPATALGEPSRQVPGPFGGPVHPFDPPYLSSELVSIGAGGSLTVKFSKPVLNHPRNRFGIDFIIFGNSFFVITNGNYSGDGITDGSIYGNGDLARVSVSRDGVVFYQLNPALAPTVDSLWPTDGSGDFHTPADPSLS